MFVCFSFILVFMFFQIEKMPTTPISSYIPWKLLNKFDLEKGQFSRSFPNAIVMSLDISGFTSLTERLSRNGLIGIELVRNVISDFFELLIPMLGCGHVIKFAGDALQVLFVDDHHEHHHEEDESKENLGAGIELHKKHEKTMSHSDELVSEVVNVAKRICLFSLDLEQRKHHYKLPSDFNPNILNGLLLKMKVCVAVGSVHLLVVGDKDKRLELIMTGEPSHELAEAEHHQTEPSRTVVAPSFWKILQEKQAKNKIKTQGKNVGEGFWELVFEVESPSNAPTTTHHEENERLKSKDDVVSKQTLEIMSKFVPLTVQKWTGVSELRKLTTLFILLEGQFTEPKCFNKIDTATKLIVQSLHRYQGELRQAIVDDKGAVQIGLFGLPFMSTDKNAKYGVMCAMKIVDELRNVGIGCWIGVATGRVYVGNCGAESRCEYVALGE